MKEFNDALASMSTEELEMAIREQDNINIKVLTEAVLKQQEVNQAQDKLIKVIEKTVLQVVDAFQKERKETRAKLEVLATSLDRIEVQLGNREEGSRNKKEVGSDSKSELDIMVEDVLQKLEDNQISVEDVLDTLDTEKED